MRRTSIGSRAYAVGPYGEHLRPFDTVLEKLAELEFDGIELGGVDVYPNPQNRPTKEDREALETTVAGHGFAFNKAPDILPQQNFGILYDICHGQMVAVNGTMQEEAKETPPGGQLELRQKLSDRINHIHLIDSDNTCHRDANGEDETSAHPPFGESVLDVDALVPALAKEDVGHDWSTVDLCVWPDGWQATAKCKTARYDLNWKYG